MEKGSTAEIGTRANDQEMNHDIDHKIDHKIDHYIGHELNQERGYNVEFKIDHRLNQQKKIEKINNEIKSVLIKTGLLNTKGRGTSKVRFVPEGLLSVTIYSNGLFVPCRVASLERPSRVEYI